MHVHRSGGTGPVCRVICGKFAVDEHAERADDFASLASPVHIRHQDSARVRSFTATLDLLAGEVRQRESGSERAASLLTEMLLIQVVRMVLPDTRHPHRPAGSPACAILRSAPRSPLSTATEQPWSVDSLAAKAGLSRSVFAERFAARLGRTPMSYLARVAAPDRGALPPRD